MHLTWIEVQSQFENLVKFAAKNTFEIRKDYSIDSAVSAEDLYQVGMIKLFDCWKRYAHLPMNEFKAIFSKSLFRSVYRSAKYSNTYDIEPYLESTESTKESAALEEILMNESLRTLKKSLRSNLSVAILSELIDPSPKTLWHVWADRSRKECVKNQGKRVNIPKNNDVKMKHIREALEITQKQFDLAILEIRDVAKIIVSEEGAFV